MTESRSHFSRRVNRALDDPNLQKALIGAMTGLRGRRNAAFESFDFAEGRAELKRRRQANLDRIPELLEQFAQRLAAVGGVVHIVGTEPTVHAIQQHARESLRQKFIEATVGISGANMAIAETGTIVLVTNEGNADLTTTLPPVHIALFGIDKLVASLDDAVAVLRMLPRSGTGQIMSSYVNWITGPSRSADIEQSLTIGVHGPREMHCVILDNGREEMLEDAMFRDTLTCIRCGACSNACPPFMAVGGHQFGGHIYNGPIGLVLTPIHHGLEDADLANTLCAQCNACQEICPVDIPLPRLILEHRRKGRKSLRKRAVLGMWKRPKLADALMRAAAPFSGFVPGAPRLARTPYRDRVEPHHVEGEPLTIFASCLGDRAWPGAAVALERIASAAGFNVGFPKDQWCCGLMAANAGDFKTAYKLTTSLAESLRNSKGVIVTPSASCFGAFTMDALEWGDPPLQEVRDRMRDSTRFVLQLLEADARLVDDERMSLKIAYHDSCQTLRQLGLKSEPRRVLELAGYEVVDLPDIANCCGFGGSFSLEWPRVADRLAEWKLDAIAKTGCAVVASDNPGCLMHIAAAARKRGVQLRVAHVLELVAEHLA